ncbi:unnamed protein product [Dovyalis caffra]|uniref:Uncharacterized protein n=1 Tax=Dovyalis caffra TaxID=77055 RepID=A0AAV1QM49_9ROSI|nr:unnamed protein product [Dovyalis caffra]
MPRELWDFSKECMDVVPNFKPCLGFIQGLLEEPTHECCMGYLELNDISKQNHAAQRICFCIEEIAATDDPPFLVSRINAILDIKISGQLVLLVSSQAMTQLDVDPSKRKENVIFGIPSTFSEGAMDHLICTVSF